MTALPVSSDTANAPGACLFCHAVDTTVTQNGLDHGEYWRCKRCGQLWDATRVAVATAYNRSIAPPAG